MQIRKSHRPSCFAALSLLMLLGAWVPSWADKLDEVVDPYYEYRDEVGRGEFRYDDSEDIPWIENETAVLAMPRPEDLSPVRLDTTPDGIEILIDRSRIDVSPKDRVVRVWLWARSRAGAETGSYEGFRCETSEYKVYAYANPRRDPPVTKAKRPRWIGVGLNPVKDYRAELLRDYFCGIRGTRTTHEIREYLAGPFRRERFLSE